MSSQQSQNRNSTDREIRKRTVVSFSVFGVGICLAIAAWLWLFRQPESADGIQPTLRKGLELNENLFSRIYSRKRQSKPYKKQDATSEVRVNGDAIPFATTATNPLPFHLAGSSYILNQWDSMSASGVYPPNMMFHITTTSTPTLTQ